MSIGSFLASAGRIGTGIEQAQTDSELRRLQREQAAGARAEMSRQEKLRLEQLAVTAPELPPQGLMLGAPAQVVEPEVIAAPAGVKTDTAPTPAPVATPAVVPGVVPAAAPTGRRVMKLDGKVIAPLDRNKPDRLGSGVAGFQKIDPNMSDFDKKYRSGINEQRLDATLGKLEARLAQSLSTIRKPFVSQKEKQRIEKSDYASDWYGTKEARDYFRRNPEMLAVADKNPLGFFNGLVKANALAKKQTTAPAKAAVPAAAAPATGGGSYANVPFAQVKDVLISKEGPASLGGYNAIAYNTSPTKNAAGVPQPPKPLTSMSMVEVLKFQREVMRPKTRGYRNPKDVGSTGVGAYQFESGTLAENAKLTFGKGWESQPFSAENQDKIAETLYNRVRGNPTRLRNTWFAFKDGGTAPSAATGGAPASGAGGAGVQLASSAAETPAPVRMDPSSFYLANQDAVPRDMQVALQNRQELARMAGMYQRAGMGAEFTQMRLKVMELDNSLTFLQGMQGIQELALANDPRRLAAVWSQYTGVPVQLQPQTDGTYNVMVNGQVTQRGVKSGTIIDAARSSFDAEYRNAQAASASAMSMKQFESGLKIGEQAAKTLGDLTSALQQKQLEGANAAALEVLKNDLKIELERQNPEAKVTMSSDGTGSAILSYKDGRVATFTPGGEIEINGQTVKTAPTVRAVGVGN